MTFEVRLPLPCVDVPRCLCGFLWAGPMRLYTGVPFPSLDPPLCLCASVASLTQVR